MTHGPERFSISKCLTADNHQTRAQSTRNHEMDAYLDWLAIGGASISLLIAGLSARRAARTSQRIDALNSANSLDLTTASTLPTLAANSWTAVTGEVDAEKPLLSLNRIPSAVVRESVIVTSTRLSGSSSVIKDEDVVSCTWSETPWSLTGSTDHALLDPQVTGGVTSTRRISVARDALRLAFNADPPSVSPALVGGGIALLSTPSPWFVDVAQALLGVIDRSTIQKHDIIPTGNLLTLVGSLSLQDGAAVIGLHSSLGMFAFFGTVSGQVEKWRSTLRWDIAGATLASSVSVFVVWAALRQLGYIVVDHSLWDGTLSGAARVFGSSRWQRPPPRRRSDSQELAFDAPADARSRGWRGGTFTVSFVPSPDSVASAAAISTTSSTPVASYGTDVAATSPNDECVICRERQRIVAAVPCGHLCMCAACTEVMMASMRGVGGEPNDAGAAVRCPVCRAECSSFIRVFGGGTS